MRWDKWTMWMENTSSEDDFVFGCQGRGSCCCCRGVIADMDAGTVERVSGGAGPLWDQIQIPCPCPARCGWKTTYIFLIYFMSCISLCCWQAAGYHHSVGKGSTCHTTRGRENKQVTLWTSTLCSLLHTMLPFLGTLSGQDSVDTVEILLAGAGCCWDLHPQNLSHGQSISCKAKRRW